MQVLQARLSFIIVWSNTHTHTHTHTAAYPDLMLSVCFEQVLVYYLLCVWWHISFRSHPLRAVETIFMLGPVMGEHIRTCVCVCVCVCACVRVCVCVWPLPALCAI